jgi:tRNA(Ile)-lysidine synthase
MPVLTERVCRTIGRFRLLPPGARVVVAASGGADSTALAFVLRDTASRLKIELAGLAHFNHELRGAESEHDQAFSRGLAERLGVPFEAGRGNVRAAATELRTSVEDAGRRLRYRFLDEARERLAATHVAVGHTRDDQAETLLLNLLRGAGTRGLSGMPPARGTVVRPLLECSHAELVAWLDARGVAYREDESNRDRRFTRNRLRYEVMPALERAFPGAAIALARSAATTRADAEYLETLAAESLAAVGRRGEGTLVLDAAAMRRLPRALARGVARLALLEGARARFVGVEHAERLLDLAAGVRTGSLMLPGLQADLDGDQLVLRSRQGRSAAAEPGRSSSSGNSFRETLSIPGEVLLDDGLVVSSDLHQGGPSPDELFRLAGPSVAVVDAGRFSRLAVRYRRPGDRFRPLGLNGHKTLQDFFVDRKVPRGRRGRVPLVVDGDGRIVWVAGYAVSEDFRVNDATRAVVILQLRGERV